MQAIRDEQRRHARRRPVRAHVVMYESFAGNGMLCNPEAIFRALLEAADMQHLEHIWALTDLGVHRRTVDEFRDDPRVRFVVRGSRPYYAALATAKYLVNNATFPEGFVKRPDQVYLNTWHGTPAKAMGYDVPGGAIDAGNVVRNFVSADYLLAPNADTSTMYLDGYRMRHIYRGIMICEGTPRIDRQIGRPRDEAGIRARLRRLGVAGSADERLLVYAPTWRGDFYDPDVDVEQLQTTVRSLGALVADTGYRVVLKVHQRLHHLAHAAPDLAAVLVPNDIPTNDLLAVTDVLVTDYSSIFVDFLATGRPILFYTPDLEDYAATRGFYLSPGEWPGPVCRTVEELAHAVLELGSGRPDDPVLACRAAYDAARERYCLREDGSATGRVIDIVFRASGGRYDLRRPGVAEKTSLLINLGGLRRNGITSAALALLDNIDQNRFDVSVCFPRDAHPEQRAVVDRIDPGIRLFPQPLHIVGGRIRVKLLLTLDNYTRGRGRILFAHGNRVMREEWRRLFGASRFDHVVDFSGYSPYWTKLLANRSSGSFAIWLHNDIRAELANRDRSRQMRASLRGVTGLYRAADQLVSVSPALNTINQAALAREAARARFTYARNTINHARIRCLAHELSTLPDAAAEHLVRTAAASPRPAVFVTSGRLSPEKNHARLIKAFALVHHEHSHTRLRILGSGPLRNALRALIDELSLGDAVTLFGHLDNPYPIVARSDCFVLSSDYEGQPMALLESLVLGLPVVTTDFASVRDALPGGLGTIVARDVTALADGMRRFLSGAVPAPVFDPADYNQQALQEFYGAIGAD